MLSLLPDELRVQVGGDIQPHLKLCLITSPDRSPLSIFFLRALKNTGDKATSSEWPSRLGYNMHSYNVDVLQKHCHCSFSHLCSGWYCTSYYGVYISPCDLMLHSHRRQNNIVHEGAKVSDKGFANFSHAPLLASCRVLEREGVVIDFCMHWCSTSESRSLCVRNLLAEAK